MGIKLMYFKQFSIKFGKIKILFFRGHKEVVLTHIILNFPEIRYSSNHSVLLLYYCLLNETFVQNILHFLISATYQLSCESGLKTYNLLHILQYLVKCFLQSFVSICLQW